MIHDRSRVAGLSSSLRIVQIARGRRGLGLHRDSTTGSYLRAPGRLPERPPGPRGDNTRPSRGIIMASVTLPSGWTRESLHRLIAEGLNGTSLIVVANREPYMHRLHGGQIQVVRPAGGVTA